MKQNYKMIISYDGTRYLGWQRLPNKETIQGKLEGVLNRMCNTEGIEIDGAGRTDAGVHAKGMVASVALETNYSPEEIRDYLNQYLPSDIAVLEVKIASARFHARYNAIGKTYCYTCFDGTTKPIFERKYVTILEKQPSLEKMQQAVQILQGKHDFHNFCGNPKMKKSTIRIVDSIEIQRNGDFFTFIFHGNGFLQNMVRIMVGTLLEVGYGRMSLSEVKDVLTTTERKKAGPTAPAQGLCLISVDYD
jgi:tRNA pseudouridine38-40 synthase